MLCYQEMLTQTNTDRQTDEHMHAPILNETSYSCHEILILFEFWFSNYYFAVKWYDVW